MIRSAKARRRALLATASAFALAGLAATPASAIIINDNYTPAQVIDTTDITGVGQMVVDTKNGFIGLCTATLINPRTVIFAAHCVNENAAGTGSQAANSYGAKFGGVPIGFGFSSNDLPGVRSWYLAGPNQYQTNKSLSFYNANYVAYNPRSLDLGISNNFLQGDVALAALDTPASKIPTWTLLFSPLTTPTSATASGTGYHVAITGYGTNGTGSTGASGGIDYRRRSAENMLGILGSLDDQDLFLFGAKDGLPQNLYQIDFDDPKRGTAAANPYDFNVFRDNATPKEGTIGPGDSGGPLIIDQAFSKPVVIGVLSGSDRFFNAQKSNAYGTTGFYQPLYLYWDWVVANNPYKYVGALAGDGKWTDPTHWQINLDPNYQVLSNGQLVNGLPTTTAAGITGTTPKFGQVCYQDTTSSDCQNLATGVETVTNKPIGQTTNGSAQVAGSTVGDSTTTASATSASSGAATAGGAGSNLSSGPATVSAATLTGDATAGAQASATATATADAGAATGAADGSTLTADGINTTGTPVPIPDLPGSSNFVPNNTDGNPAAGAPARYYDVTLSAAGTTTLDTRMVIDRLTISGVSSGLTITPTGNLYTNIDTTVRAGTFTVNGGYTSVGDFALIGGLLQGTGTVAAPFLTSVAGVIAPGGIGTIGRLTIQGDVILSSGSQLAIDLGPNKQSDQLVVTANIPSGNAGVLSLGGALVINPLAGYRARAGDTFAILSSTGGISGNFSTVNAISGILVPQLSYTSTTGTLKIVALPYSSIINTASSVQRAYATLLDGNRANQANFPNLYTELDLLDVASIRATLENAAPHTEVTRLSLYRAQQDSLERLYSDRASAMRRGEVAGGTLAVIGQPLLLAEADENPGPGARAMATDAHQSMVAPGMALPASVSAYVAGGYIDGNARPLPSLFSAGYRDQISGWYVAGGAEMRLMPKLTVGASFGYSEANGGLRSLSRADSRLAEGSLYGNYDLGQGFFLGARAAGGGVNSTTRRAFQANTVIYNLNGRDSAPEFSFEFKGGKDFALPYGLIATPTAAIRYVHLGVDRVTETGGDAALVFSARDFDSVQGRIGGDLGGVFRRGGLTLRPHLTAAYVHDFADGYPNLQASFVAGGPAFGLFTGPSRVTDWGEFGGGITGSVGRFQLDVSADTNIGRNDLDFQTYRASVAYRF